MLDETYWYEGAGWPTLRGQMITCFMQVVEQQLDVLSNSQTTEKTARVQKDAKFMCNALLQSLGGKNNPDNNIMWQFCLPLLADIKQLQKNLEKDKLLWDLLYSEEESDNNLSWQQVLGQNLKQFLEEARTHVLPESAARIKVWKRLSRISKQVLQSANAHNSFQENICTQGHFIAIREIIVQEYRQDKNLPKTLTTIEQYFREFCPACDQLNQLDILALIEDTDICFFDQDDDSASLDDCLKALNDYDSDLYESIDAKFGLGKMSYISHSAFRANKGISRRRYEQQVACSLELLKECLEGNLQSELTW